MENPEKKEYQAPVVIDYGDVAELTQNAGGAQSDGMGPNTSCVTPYCSNG